MGWTEQQGSTRLFNFATQITRDIHLYPVIMDGKTYTLTYDANGGTGTVPTDSNNYAKGTYAQVVSGSGLTKEGMIFLGWSTDKTAVSPAYYPGGSVKINDNTRSTPSGARPPARRPSPITATLATIKPARARISRSIP